VVAGPRTAGRHRRSGRPAGGRDAGTTDGGGAT
jgi:hypothetical protein